MKRMHLLLGLILVVNFSNAQNLTQQIFTKADTLRGTYSAERSWWDILKYDVTVKPDFATKSLMGSNVITYKAIKSNAGVKMQIDLKAPLVIDSVVLLNNKLNYKQDGAAWFIDVPVQKTGSINKIAIYYGGKVQEAVRPPWEGGWTFKTDSLGRPWMTVTCQGAAGASIWYPNKDHQSDEPDDGASLTMVVPSNLVGVSNGRMDYKKDNLDGTTTYKWSVVNPINNYCLIPYIGSYVNFKEVYAGEKGNLDLDFWVLDYNLVKAKAYMPKEVHNMLKSFEYWMGPYPFYEDGYKLIDAMYPGMEHQSAVSYGNGYKGGYGGRDQSGTGIGMKWDFIIIHESGHEWFGNNITSKDLADMWVHEGFTNYSETLFVDYIYGKKEADDYNFGIRRGIKNDKTIIPAYNVNAQGSGDMYPKGGNLLHAIRHSINNDDLFRKILRGLSSTFYHQTVTTTQVEEYISKQSKYNYSKVFDQYLRTTQIPNLEYYFNADKSKVFYRYTNSVSGFNLPISINGNGVSVKISPTTIWKSQSVTASQIALLNNDDIVHQYYITAKNVNP